MLRDLMPITLIAKTASCMCVHPGVPATNMQEFIAFAKTRPGKINYGSSGIGTVGHLASTAPFVKMGKLRALGVTSANRSSLMPEIPTVAEQGLPGFEAGNWAGMLAPKGTPPQIIARIHEILKNRLTAPEAHRLFTEQGHELAGLGPEEFGALLRSEIATWGKVAKAAGIPKE